MMATLLKIDIKDISLDITVVRIDTENYRLKSVLFSYIFFFSIFTFKYGGKVNTNVTFPIKDPYLRRET